MSHGLLASALEVGHAALKAKGGRAGQKPLLPEALRQQIAQRVASGEVLAKIAASLNESKTPTARGGQWYASTVAHVAKSVSIDNRTEAAL